MINRFIEQVGEKKIECSAKELGLFATLMCAQAQSEGKASRRELRFFFAVLEAFVKAPQKEKESALAVATTLWEMSNKLGDMLEKTIEKEVKEAVDNLD